MWLEDKRGDEVLWAKKEGKDIVIQESEATCFVSYQECHNALGHPSVQVLNRAMNDLYLDSFQIPKPPKNFHCSACSLSKSTHPVPGASYKRAENPFELIHTDLSGKFSIPSIGKRLYYITFIDDKTRYSWIAFLSQKSDTMRVIRNFIAQIDRQYNSKIQRFRSDNGGEYIAACHKGVQRPPSLLAESVATWEVWVEPWSLQRALRHKATQPSGGRNR